MSDAHGWRVPLSDVRLPDRALDAARETLRSGWLSSGPRVRQFERDVAEYVGVGHAVACSSGTAALELAYEVLDLGPGDEVAMPSLTFVAGANAARLRGIDPVLCDVIGRDDLTLDPDSLARQADARDARGRAHALRRPPVRAGDGGGRTRARAGGDRGRRACPRGRGRARKLRYLGGRGVLQLLRQQEPAARRGRNARDR